MWTPTSSSSTATSTSRFPATATSTWARPPTSTTSSAILNPDTGLANVLANFSDPKSESTETINGVETVKVTGQVSADAVNKIAPPIAATGPIPGTAWIEKDGDHKLVQAKLEPTARQQCSDDAVGLGQARHRHQARRLMTAAAPVHSSRSRRIAISAGALAVLLGALDTYVVVTIIRDIMSDVGIAINQIQRVTPIVTGYLLGYIAAMPLLGRASDRFGRKMLLQVSLAGFAIGSVVTAMSTDLTMLVIGRVIQGAASGALLPVTLALAADLWAARNRAGVLGGIGAAQELGSVLGPMYGIALVWVFHHWQSRVLGQRAAGGDRDGDDPLQPAVEAEAASTREKVDVVGGVLLAITLGLIVVGMYNPAPDGKQVLPSLRSAAADRGAGRRSGVLRVGTLRQDPADRAAGVHFRPFLAALGASLTAGAALMVTLVNVELFGQGVLGQDQNEAAFLLLRFLIALPIGALLGGWIATRVGDRAVACVGLLIAAGGYYLIAQWPVDLLAARHDLGFISLPLLDTDLAIAGLGLGLVIGPLTSATLRVVPSAQHGIASAAVVVSRMIGMLVGIAALSAWGLYRFNQILQSLPTRPADSLAAKLAVKRRSTRPRSPCNTARCSVSPRSSASSAPSWRCSSVGARSTPTSPESVPAVEADDEPTAMIDAPTRAFAADAGTAAGVRRLDAEPGPDGADPRNTRAAGTAAWAAPAPR